jgi:hypothetical protein
VAHAGSHQAKQKLNNKINKKLTRKKCFTKFRIQKQPPTTTKTKTENATKKKQDLPI